MSGGPTTPVRPDKARTAIAHILASVCFAKSDRLRDFIRFTVDRAQAGEAHRIKESTIALEVYCRDAERYNSKTDPIVRTEARRLRAKLEEYYEGEGKNDRIGLSYPKGAYLPSFEHREMPSEPTETPPAPPSARPFLDRLSPRVVAVALVVIVITAVYATWSLRPDRGDKIVRPNTLQDTPRVAVLPFEDLSPSGDQAPLGLAMADAVINDLVRIGGTAVTSRTSAQQYIGSDLPAPKVASRLGADYLVKGSLMKVGDRCRVTAQLVDGRSDTHVWSDDFDFAWSKIFEVQRAIAKQVAAQVAGRPTSVTAETGALEPRLDAYEAAADAAYYLRQYAATRDEDDYQAARRWFEEALTLEPDYGEALSKYGHLLFHRLYPPQSDRAEVLREARHVLERALAIDPSHARSLALLSEIADAEGQRDQALEMAERAVVLDPFDVVARIMLAFRYRGRGFYEAALIQISHATETDRFWLYGHYLRADILCLLGRYDEAREVVAHMTGIHPTSPATDWSLGAVQIAEDETAQAVETLEEALRGNPERMNASFLRISLALAAELNGDTATGARVLEEYGDSPPRMTPHLQALCFAVGDIPRAVQRTRSSHLHGNYRWLIKAPSAQPYLGEPEVRELLDFLWARWQADLRAAAPGPQPRPPELPPPAEVLATAR